MSVFERARLLGYGLLAATFVAGALAGAAIDRAVVGADGPTEKARDRDRNDRERSYIIDRVDMSESQRASIDSILERRVERMRAVWREAEPRLDAITDSARSEIMDVLTPEQQERYKSMLKQRRGGDGKDDEDGGGGSDGAEASSNTGAAGGHRDWRG